MTATDVLRRLLDERGVEWTSGGTEVSRNKYTHFCPDAGMSMGVWESGDGKLGIDAHTDYRFTPEQAIAATLRQAVRHPKPREKWTTVLLPEIAWNWHDRWPDYLSVAHDAHGEWRVYVPEDTLGSCNCSSNCTNGERTETCHVESSIIDTYEYNRWEYELSCGHTIIWEDSEPPRYCPECGRRIEQ